VCLSGELGTQTDRSETARGLGTSPVDALTQHCELKRHTNHQSVSYIKYFVFIIIII